MWKLFVWDISGFSVRCIPKFLTKKKFSYLKILSTVHFFQGQWVSKSNVKHWNILSACARRFRQFFARNSLGWSIINIEWLHTRVDIAKVLFALSIVIVLGSIDYRVTKQCATTISPFWFCLSNYVSKGRCWSNVNGKLDLYKTRKSNWKALRNLGRSH